MSEKSRARFLQRHTDMSYQQALQRVRSQWPAAVSLHKRMGWPLTTCDLYLVDKDKALHRVQEDLYTRVHTLLHEGNYVSCNELLASFEHDKYPLIVGIGMLRAALPARGMLPAWDVLRDKVLL